MKGQRILIITLLLTLLVAFFSGCAVKIPVPEVREGRFNFSVTYEVNGEEKTYSGVYVCKFEGVHKSVYGGGRDWSGYIENDEENGMIAIQTNEERVIRLAFHLSPEYIMADPDFELFEYEIPAPSLALVYHSDDPNSQVIETGIDFMSEYGVRIISYDYPEPIENTYEEKWEFGRMEIGIN